ncbi:MAG: hypothetical protein U1E57_03940 [Paenacidovorax caeni]
MATLDSPHPASGSPTGRTAPRRHYSSAHDRPGHAPALMLAIGAAALAVLFLVTQGFIAQYLLDMPPGHALRPHGPVRAVRGGVRLPGGGGLRLHGRAGGFVGQPDLGHRHHRHHPDGLGAAGASHAGAGVRGQRLGPLLGVARWCCSWCR